MPINTMPAVDVQACSGWTENQITLYNSLPFYFAKQQVERRKSWTTWSRIMKKRRWTPNMGDTMRGISTEPSPHLRQFIYPNPLKQMPKKDVMNVLEVTNDAQLYRHRFESPVLNFFPSFNDFMDHVDDTSNDIMEKIERAEDVYIRQNVFQMAPRIAVAQGTSIKIIESPAWKGSGTFTDGVDGKTAAFLKDVSANNAASNLTLASLAHLISVAETDFRIPFFSGDSIPKDDAMLNQKFLLTTSTEAFMQFNFDPYLLQHKNCDLDTIHNGFQGSIFGRLTSRMEDLPLRMKSDGTFAAPEIRVDSNDPLNANITVANPAYSIPDENGSPYEWAFLIGLGGYESLEVGPPPKPFSSDTPPDNFPKMTWNGEVRLTKHFLTQCVDSDTGNVVYEANTYGEYLKFISQVVLGVVPIRRRNIIPILFKRKRGVA